MGVTAQMKAMIDHCQCLWARKCVLKVAPLVFFGVDEKGAISQQPEALQQAFEAGERLAEDES